MQNPASTPDEILRTAILTAFEVDKRVASVDLRVGVLNGIAHLACSVDTLIERAVAEEIAQHVVGVRGVVNRIDAPGAPSPARIVNLNLNDRRKDIHEE